MGEGRRDAPMRHPVNWQEEAYGDEAALDREVRRVFDICHGCRRCFPLCASFPRLFDLIDATPSGEPSEVVSSDFKSVFDACTLCDMCFMTQCPYVPPHEFDVDVPHLVLRYRALEHGKGAVSGATAQLVRSDRNGRLGTALSSLANWALDRRNELTRPVIEKVAGVHREAVLPAFAGVPLVRRAEREQPFVDITAPGYGRKAVLYATCHGNHHDTDLGMAVRAVLARNGVETEIVYPGCCGAPHWETGDLATVAEQACLVAAALSGWVERGYAVIALVPRCAWMMKFEWPLLVPPDWEESARVGALARATFDVSEYIVELADTVGLADGLQPLDGGVFLHVACHARAQNMGRKAAEMLRLIPRADLTVEDRCAGHGGLWGLRTETFETAMALGEPLARAAVRESKPYLASECPQAAAQIALGMERAAGETGRPRETLHPIQLLARAYGL